MIPRYPGRWRTGEGIYVRHIIQCVDKFPLLHAFGIGLEPFKDFPEKKRVKALNYSKYLLSHCLDSEVDAAIKLFMRLGRPSWESTPFYVSTEYIQLMYKYFRKARGYRITLPQHVPVGTIILAALLRGNRVVVTHDIKPHALVGLLYSDWQEQHQLYVSQYEMPDWDIEQIKMGTKNTITDNRKVESDDAIEIDGDKYGDIWEQDDDSDG